MITDYPRFVGNSEKAIETTRLIQSKYDNFDTHNSEAATEFLENSLDNDLRRNLDLMKEEDDSFCVRMDPTHETCCFLQY